MNERCEWTEDSDGVWNTDCGHTFTLNDGTPKENGFKFCCYCGAPLVEDAYREED